MHRDSNELTFCGKLIKGKVLKDFGCKILMDTGIRWERREIIY